MSKFKFGQVYSYKNLDELNARVDGIATRMKKKDCIDLPPVSFVDVSFDLTSTQIDEYDACIAHLRDRLFYNEVLAGKGVFVAHGGALVNKLLQIISGFELIGADPSICDGCHYLTGCVANSVKPYTQSCQLVQIKPKTTVKKLPTNKITAFKNLLENILESDETNKVIIWANYLEELNNIEDCVKSMKIDYVRVDGGSMANIGELSKRFQTDDACRVYIGQVQSGVGVTLTKANYMIYYSLTWNLTSYKQSLERNNRPGQTRNMTVYRLLSSMPGALDRFLAKMLAFKDQVAYTMLERITCGGCENKEFCASQEIKPFRKGCKYAATVDRPTATAEYLKERIPNETNTNNE